MRSGSSGRRPRRQFSDEFKEGAVRLVLDEGKTVGAVARELDLTASASPGTSSSLVTNDAERASYPLSTLCRTFGVPPGGFYAWRTRPESNRTQEDRRVKVLVHASFTGGRGYYGSPRLYDDFLEWQEPISRKRIIRLMVVPLYRLRTRAVTPTQR